nr:hypothetical protein [Tanacetum cinerariifolium]
MDQYVVNMDTRVCSCKKWELIGIPCKHVMAEIYNVFENSIRVGIPELWVLVAYRLETCQAGGSSKAYARQAAGARNVSGQAVGAINASSQAGVSSQPNAAASTATGARNFSSQAVTFHIFRTSGDYGPRDQTVKAKSYSNHQVSYAFALNPYR